MGSGRLSFEENNGEDDINNPGQPPPPPNNEEGEGMAADGGDSDSDFSSGSSMLDSSDEDGEQEGPQPAKENKEEDEVDEEDPVVKAIVKAKEKKESTHPPDLVLEDIPSTLCFHPVEDNIVFGNYEGRLLFYSYSVEETTKQAESHHKNSSVRCVTFSNDGDKLISAYSDHTIRVYDVGNGLQVERTLKNATPSPVSSMYIIDEHVFATGDDDGNVLIWDNRSNKNVAGISLRLGEDAITSMVSNDDRRILVCTSEEGAVYAVKIRAGKMQVASEIYDYEFNCSCVFKQESKVAVGDGKGDVYVFNWDEFGKHSDICTGIGRGEAVNALIPITEKIILSGGDDGFIRAFNFFPHKYLGIVGKVGHPVEKMDVCNDGHLISSIGADETVKFWNVSYFESMKVPSASSSSTKEGSKETGGAGSSKKTGHQKSSGQKQELQKNNLPSSSHQNAADFFKGLAD